MRADVVDDLIHAVNVTNVVHKSVQEDSIVVTEVLR